VQLPLLPVDLSVLLTRFSFTVSIIQKTLFSIMAMCTQPNLEVHPGGWLSLGGERTRSQNTCSSCMGRREKGNGTFFVCPFLHLVIDLLLSLFLPQPLVFYLKLALLLHRKGGHHLELPAALVQHAAHRSSNFYVDLLHSVFRSTRISTEGELPFVCALLGPLGMVIGWQGVQRGCFGAKKKLQLLLPLQSSLSACMLLQSTML